MGAAGNRADGSLLRRVRRLLAPRVAPRARKRRSAAGTAALAVPVLLLALMTGVAAVRSAGAAAEGEAAEADAATVNREPTAAERALYERVKTTYGRARAAIETVQYDYSLDMGQGPEQAERLRYARSGERVYTATERVWGESSWDGHRVYDRSPDNDQRTRLLLREGKRVTTNLPMFATSFDSQVTTALDLPPEVAREPGSGGNDRRTYRLRAAREVNDPTHGDCIELEYEQTSDSFRGTHVMRHARRYDYAPVYRLQDGRIVGKFAPPEGKNTYRQTLGDVRYATVRAGSAERHYPVDFTEVQHNPGGFVSTSRWWIDEATLKINEPIPRSRFVLKPWPNSVTYDFLTKREAKATDPSWSPVGKVGFPWLSYLEATDPKNKGKRRVILDGVLQPAEPDPQPAEAPDKKEKPDNADPAPAGDAPDAEKTPSAGAPASPPTRPTPATAPAAGDAAAPEPSAAERELFDRVKAAYRQARAAVESVEYDFVQSTDGRATRGRYARSGDRQYVAAGASGENAWDGRRNYSRLPMNDGETRLNLRTGDEWFNPHIALPEIALYTYVARALGFDEPLQPGLRAEHLPAFRFLAAREVIDATHGECVELEFDHAGPSTRGRHVMRFARRYEYAPVYLHLDGRLAGPAAGKGGGEPYAETLTDVRYAKVRAGGAERHFPVGLRVVANVNAGQGGHAHEWQIDEATLKVNGPIPRSRFVLKPWPNSTTYDFETRREVPPSDPNWSPVGKVGFPWVEYVEHTYGKRR
jgi:hypothetical protein